MQASGWPGPHRPPPQCTTAAAAAPPPATVTAQPPPQLQPRQLEAGEERSGCAGHGAGLGRGCPVAQARQLLWAELQQARQHRQHGAAGRQLACTTGPGPGAGTGRGRSGQRCRLRSQAPAAQPPPPSARRKRRPPLRAHRHPLPTAHRPAAAPTLRTRLKGPQQHVFEVRHIHALPPLVAPAGRSDSGCDGWVGKGWAGCSSFHHARRQGCRVAEPTSHKAVEQWADSSS